MGESHISFKSWFLERCRTGQSINIESMSNLMKQSSGYIKQWAYSFSQANVEQYLSKTMLFNGIIE